MEDSTVPAALKEKDEISLENLYQSSGQSGKLVKPRRAGASSEPVERAEPRRGMIERRVVLREAKPDDALLGRAAVKR
jgi:hypothetical protein